MKDTKILNFIEDVLKNIPTGWLNLTTHRLDIYDEKLAKTKFLEELELLFKDNNSKLSSLSKLPTAYDYIRLGHPLSCLLEWFIARSNNINPRNVISFSSMTIPIMGILRKNLLNDKLTQIFYIDKLPDFIDFELLKSIYGYKFDCKKIEKIDDIAKFNGSSIFISQNDEFTNIYLKSEIDFFINIQSKFGSILLVNGDKNNSVCVIGVGDRILFYLSFLSKLMLTLFNYFKFKFGLITLLVKTSVLFGMKALGLGICLV